LIAELHPRKTADLLTTTWVFHGVRLSTRITPADHADQGGDWCETFALSDSVVALSIGDVSGHGIDAAPARLLASHAIRLAAFAGLDPSETLAAANLALCELDPEIYATGFFALLDTWRGVVSFANAGHPAPLMIGPAGSWFLSYAKADLALGIKSDRRAAVRAARMPAQTLLVLYTDGVTEHDRQALRGEGQLRDAARVAYDFSASSTASTISALMPLGAVGSDDASILTAWMPHDRTF
jgi:serine phosphatase RsbU (regulator of sigma subunit)